VRDPPRLPVRASRRGAEERDAVALAVELGAERSGQDLVVHGKHERRVGLVVTVEGIEVEIRDQTELEEGAERVTDARRQVLAPEAHALGLELLRALVELVRALEREAG